MKLYTDWPQFVTAVGDYINHAPRPCVSHVHYDASGVVTLATQGIVVALLPRDVKELAQWLKRQGAPGA